MGGGGVVLNTSLKNVVDEFMKVHVLVLIIDVEAVTRCGQVGIPGCLHISLNLKTFRWGKV